MPIFEEPVESADFCSSEHQDVQLELVCFIGGKGGHCGNLKENLFFCRNVFVKICTRPDEFVRNRRDNSFGVRHLRKKRVRSFLYLV